MLNLKALQHHAGKFFHSYYFKLEAHLRHKIKATVTCAGTSLSDLEKRNGMQAIFMNLLKIRSYF